MRAASRMRTSYGMRAAIGLCLMCSWVASAQQVCVVPTDGLVVTQDTMLCSGQYYLTQGITIAAEGVTLEGHPDGTVLMGRSDEGSGLSAADAAHVIVRNLTIHGYFHGMHFDRCDDLSIENCTIEETYEQLGDFLDIFAGPDGGYGHAMWIRSCDRAVIRGNQVGRQQNGISLFHCDRCLIENNQASDNSGWGISLYHTCRTTIRNNVANDCTRIAWGYNGGDAANLLMVVSSCENTVVDNTFLRGGDGVFISGFSYLDGPQPNNDNYFARNDCSGSPNNGFEATFSQGNVFEDNISNNCNYGYWLGYSSTNAVRGNRVDRCTTAGVAIEHGHDNLVENNQFSQDGKAVWLWTDEDGGLVRYYPECKDSHTSTVRNNAITRCPIGILCEAYDADRASYGHTISGNTLEANQEGIRLFNTRQTTVRSNLVRDSIIVGVKLTSSADNTIFDNDLRNAANAMADLPNAWSVFPTLGRNIVGGRYLGGNFWSDYSGADTDGDGFGDTDVPYYPAGNSAIGGDSCPLVVTKGDFDRDGDLDMEDFGHMQACFVGIEQGGPSANCADADFNGDHRVDKVDLAAFLSCARGAATVVDSRCIP